MAYHAGALKALDDFGVDVEAFDLVIGTSAGAILGSYLRSGWSPSDFFDYAHGRHRDAVGGGEEEHAEVRALFEPLYGDLIERARRGVGSFFALASSRGLYRGGTKGRLPVTPLRRLFPSGMYSTQGTRERFERDLPTAWPDKSLYVCTTELYSGRRVPFGRSGAPPASLPEAVLASTAIPGVFPPVRVGGVQYVDGGVTTATSLDLAVADGCESIICIAPLGYRPDLETPARDPQLWGPMLVRSVFARSLRREVRAARESGVHVLVIRPWLSDLRLHGANSMRHLDRRAVTDGAREGTLRLLEDNADHAALRVATKKGA